MINKVRVQRGRVQWAGVRWSLRVPYMWMSRPTENAKMTLKCNLYYGRWVVMEIWCCIQTTYTFQSPNFPATPPPFQPFVCRSLCVNGVPRLAGTRADPSFVTPCGVCRPWGRGLNANGRGWPPLSKFCWVRWLGCETVVSLAMLWTAGLYFRNSIL